jgi:hypothetical protein
MMVRKLVRSINRRPYTVEFRNSKGQRHTIHILATRRKLTRHIADIEESHGLHAVSVNEMVR